jgi:hypothetical protein
MPLLDWRTRLRFQITPDTATELYDCLNEISAFWHHAAADDQHRNLSSKFNSFYVFPLGKEIHIPCGLTDFVKPRKYNFKFIFNGEGKKGMGLFIYFLFGFICEM